MPAFPKPRFPFQYQVPQEVAALQQHRQTRGIPGKAADRLLLVTWNIANLGLQERRPSDCQLIAEILSWFDLAAIQEVNDDLTGLREVQKHLPNHYRVLISDMAGNKERMAFLYDTRKVELLEKVGEIAIPPNDLKNVKLPGIQQAFTGFDRNPYLAAFKAGNFTFLLVSVHLFYGSEKPKDIDRRTLETFAVARWCDMRRKSKNAYTQDIIALGDFNLPMRAPSDPIFHALTRRGLQLPQHSSEMGATIQSDNHYDQIAFFPGATQNDFTGNMGVFDFDAVIFRTLWQGRPHKDFFSYVKYYISDHRPLWAEFRTT